MISADVSFEKPERIRMAVVEPGLHHEPSQNATSLREIAVPAAMGIALLVGLAFRWLNLQRWSLWWDEGFTVWASGLPLGRIIPFARSDNQAPLYYLLQHYWDVLFGNSEFALRSLSAVFGTLALVLFYFLAKKILKDRIAVALAFWLFAFSLRQIWYAREARVYEIASFFALLSLYGLVQFLEKRSVWPFVTVVLASALTLYLHNMMFFYLLALDIVWLLYPSEKPWIRRIPELLLANFCMALLYLPWAVTLLAQVGAVAGNLYWVPKPSFQTLLGTLASTAGFDMDLLGLVAKKLPSPLGLGFVYSAQLGLLVLCGTLLVGGLWHVSNTERRKNLCFIVYGLLPILLIFILSRRMPLYIDRVFTTSSIVVPIIFAFPLVAQKDPKFKRLYSALGFAVGVLTALSSLGFFQSGESFARNRENWRGVVATVLTIPETNRLVLFVPPAGEIFFDYYSRNFPAKDTSVARTGLQEDFRGKFPPPKSRIITEQDVDHLRALLASQKYFEIDVVMTHEIDPQGLILNYLDHNYIRQKEPPPSDPRIRIIPFRSLPRP
jgi:4-amino-4-deoxy-L-arabinose transferase-like glycosyltransferase